MSRLTLRAKWVLPVDGPAIADGQVVTDGETILEVRQAPRQRAADELDLGNAIILPGLVNAHTHLDYTAMRGLIEELEFFPWVRAIAARAFQMTDEDWIASARWGAAEALAAGITSIGDCSFSGAALQAARESGLGGVVYREVFGIDESRPVETIMAELRDRVRTMRQDAAGSPVEAGISPHSPYTVRPELFRAVAAYAAEEDLRVCIHAAESRAEAELLRSGTGPLADMFTARGIAWSAPGCGTVEYLDSLDILKPTTLLVHGVQVNARDLALVQRRGASWVHCPKSNAKLGNGLPPLGLLGYAQSDSAGLALGTDSVASNNTMDMFEEMRFALLMQRAAHRRIGDITAHDVIAMATRGGSKALGAADRTGSLAPGKRADLCVVGLNAAHITPAYDPESALVYSASASDVLLTICGGVIRYDARTARDDERFSELPLAQMRSEMQRVAQRLLRETRTHQ